jgi:cytochrome P450
VHIPIGSQVALLFASANHDDEVFPKPEEFNPQRPVGHLSFGHGIHTCLGVGLARLEMAALLKEVLKRIPRVRLGSMPVDTGMIFGHHVG